MLKLLRARYCDPRQGGNGGAFAFLTHVRSNVGAEVGRTCDAVAMSLWPSRGLNLHGHEIKCSRADWLSELRNPAKAEVFFPLVNYWWLVVTNKEIVQPGELPDGWGLIAPHGKRLRVVQEAAKREIESLPHSFVAALLRKLAEFVVGTPENVAKAATEARESERRMYEASEKLWSEQVNGMRERMREFEQASGVSLSHWHRGHSPAEVGEALRLVLRGDDVAQAARQRLEQLLRQSQTITDHLQRTLELEQTELF